MTTPKPTPDQVDAEAAGTPEAPMVPEIARGPHGPRIRWAAIIWGAIAAIIAVITIVITGSEERRAAFLRWAGQLNGADIGLLVALVVGALILLFGLLAVLRRRA